MNKKWLISALALVVLMISAQAPSGRLHPALEERLQRLGPGEKIPVIIELSAQARPEDLISKIPGVPRGERTWAVVNALRNTAEQQQQALRAHLKREEESGAVERVIPFWVFNGIAVTAGEPLIRSLAARHDVREVRLDRRIPVPSLSSAPSAAGQSSPQAEWNIEAIRAPEVWALNPSYNGGGAVIGSFDTGVDMTHPDLYTRYRGNHQISWFDPYGEHPVPYDFHGHGTHTTGTAVGGSASGYSIGVAPGATWIAAKGWNDAGIGLASAFHQIFEWFLAPGGDAESAPDVVNCSWAFEEGGCDTEFLPDIQAWRAAGIFPVFSSGNNGPAPGSVQSPAAYPISFAVGATDFGDSVADFSGQGPSPCDGSIKPDISAPGDGVFSSIPGGYDLMSGTSMAAPHVSGAVAVLRAINPALTVDQLEAALTTGALDLGEPGPDNASGAGRLDLFVAAQVALLGPDVPVVKITAADAAASEAGPDNGAFSVSRNGNTDLDLEVKLNVGGTATAGSDYESIAGSVVIPAGSESVAVPVITLDDLLAEADETVLLTIVSDPSYIISASDSATVTIKSDELLPDLVIPSFTAPTTGGAGQNISVTETVKNQGAGAADPSLTQFYLSTNSAYDASDILLGGRSVQALETGASSSGSTTLTIPQETASGRWYLIALADGEKSVSESSESNNANARSINIGPDLDVTVLSAPAAAGAGQSITVSDTIKNTGAGTAGESLTRFFLSADTVLDASDLALGGRDVPALAAGASNSGAATVTIPETTAAGNWNIIARADAEEAVSETSETNNTYARLVRIGPDLDITSLSAPTTASSGQSIAVTDTTGNPGGAASPATTTLFSLSADSRVDASDTVLGSRAVPALAAGASSSGSTTVTIPPGTETGSWYIIGVADADEIAAETSETNNTYARSIKIGPDLTVTSLSAPATAGPGQDIVVSDTIKNQGGGVAAASLTEIYLSLNSILDGADSLLGTRSVPALAAGAASSGSTGVKIPAEAAVGNWYIIARADAGEAVNETSEANNFYSRSIKIGPDLDVTALSAPATAGAGLSIVVSDTTKNQGGGTADPSRTQFYLSINSTVEGSDIILGSRGVPALAGGATNSGSVSVTIPAGTATGSWYIVAQADADGAVTETSETNNIYARSIKIGPDLAVTSLSAPTSAAAGQAIAVADTTKNQGGGSAEPSLTQFYLSINSIFDASDSLLGSREVTALAGGAASAASTSVTIPPGTAAGTWYIIARADAEAVVIETSETNNNSARSIKIN
jgi:subtilase family serine protease